MHIRITYNLYNSIICVTPHSLYNGHSLCDTTFICVTPHSLYNGHSFRGWRRVIRCPILIGHFPQKSLIFSGSFAKRTCNLRHPMGLGHSVCVQCTSVSGRRKTCHTHTYTQSLSHAHTHTNSLSHPHIHTHRHTHTCIRI